MEIDPTKVKIVWVAYSYDGQLGWGHAWYEKQYCYVQGDNGFDKNDEEYGTYDLYALTGQHLLHELARRQMFCDLVGVGHFMVNEKLVPKHKTAFSGNPLHYYNELKQTIPETDTKNLEFLGTYRAYERDKDD